MRVVNTTKYSYIENEKVCGIFVNIKEFNKTKDFRRDGLLIQ